MTPSHSGSSLRDDDQIDQKKSTAECGDQTEHSHSDVSVLAEPLSILESNCWDLRCVDIPTGAGDADIGWQVIEHHMAPPKERIVDRGSSPLEALTEAMSGANQ